MTDLQMMQNVGEWPHLTGLPLKRRTGFDFHNENSFGVLVSSGLVNWTPNEKPRVIFGANVWNVASFKDKEVKEYENLDEVVRDWKVD